MNLVREEKLDRQIKKEFEYDFEIGKEGVYIIEIYLWDKNNRVFAESI